MEDSEFVVIDEDGSHSVKEAVQRLKKAENAYYNAHDALVKSNILLQDSLNLALHQALQSVEPDFNTDIEQLTQRINDSLYTSTDSVLRDHVKSLCARLVGVSTENTTLSDKLHLLTLQLEEMPKLNRLATLIDETSSLLAPNELVDPSGNDVEKLCERVEAIRDHILATQAKSQKSQPETQGTAEAVEKPSQKPEPQEEPSPSTSSEAKPMDISKMIREEVSSVLTREIGTILAQQKDLIQEALKPIAAQQIRHQQQQQPLRQLPPFVVHDQATDPVLPPMFLNPKLNQESPVYPKAFFTYSPTPTVLTRPTVPRNVPPELVPKHLPFMEYPTALPREKKPEREHHRPQPKPTTPSHWAEEREQQRPLPKPTAPSYWPEEETPTCPKCNLQCDDRMSLEAHLEKCLEH